MIANDKLLIVEDDMSINNMITEALKKSGYDCTQAFSGTEALLCTKVQKFQLIILDLMLPGITGEQFLKEFRAKEKVPVIVLSAKDELDSKVDLLTIGADDYITKPFELRELEARILVQLRRVQSQQSDLQELSYEELTLSPENFLVTIENHPLNLTRQEYKILELLLKHPKKIFSKQEIYQYAWDDIYIGEDKTINVHISNIRSKLKQYTAKEYIETVWGVGFRLHS